MKKNTILLFMAFIVLYGCKKNQENKNDTKSYYTLQELRDLYSSGDQKKWPEPSLDSSIVGFKELGVLPQVKFPEDNPYTKEKRELGKLLFHDPRLSSSGQISCASCHNPDLGWADGTRVPFGHDRTPGVRNTLSIMNIGHAEIFFWDGRVNNLEDQAVAAIENPIEMNNDMMVAIDTLQKIKKYQRFFKEVYGDTIINKERILKAIVTFERTIVSRKSDFDRFILGDSNKLTDEQVLGLHLFRTKARCINCHHSPYFSDQQFHNVGLSYYGRKYEDLGLYRQTGKKEDVGKFKTPTLRQISQTAPYMHNGLFPHLRGVLNMYNAGMPRVKPKGKQVNDTLFPSTSPLLKELHLTDTELKALEAFLESLSPVIYREKPPESYPI